jgi:hypothetical protein
MRSRQAPLPVSGNRARQEAVAVHTSIRLSRRPECPSTGVSASSHDRAPRSHLDACHAARVEHYQPVAVAAAQDTGLLAQHFNDMLDQLTLVDLAGILICQVRVLAPE